DVFLSRRLKRLSRARAQEIIRSGGLSRADGPPLNKPSHRVFEGETVLLRRRKLNEEPPEDIRLPVVYEDADLIAINKPGDVVVHPTASAYHRTVIRIARARLNEPELDLAHRIDKETSGLVIMSRNPAAATHLSLQFARRTVEKSYLAVVLGAPEWDERTIELPLRLVPDSLTKCLMEVGGAGAQPALTHVRVVARGDRTALVEARPKTGRQHQIRLHLAHIGHPILGDKLYFGSEDFFVAAIRGDYDEAALVGSVGHPRQALHAWQASFQHPEDGRTFTQAAPLPEDMVALARRMRIPVPEALCEATPPPG
ncbi:MAG: RluA family pseudouridine synthase, partial [Myxococcales bacterium]|nr:RluA family pseudouridine synthase [Myxococcales bacterium]